MSLTDFTIEGNPQIKRYLLDRDDSYTPSSELIYLHEHPLIRESFLGQIESMVNQVSVLLSSSPPSQAVLDRFINRTKALGALLPNVDRESAPKILSELRELYHDCTALLKHYDLKKV